MNTSFPGAQIRASALCLLAVLVPACTGFDEASDADDDVSLTVASQAIGTAPPIHDPRWVQLFHDGVVGNGSDHLTRVRCGRVGSSGLGILASA